MGRDKATLPFGHETSLARVVRLAGVVAADVVVVGQSPASRGLAVRVVGDPGEGPLVALGVALGSVTSERVLLVGCDMPLVRPALLGRLLDLLGEHDACVPRIEGMPMPTCAAYARRTVDVVQSLVQCGERSLRALLGRLSVRWVDEPELRQVDPDLESFIDCDTPEDYATALRLAGV
jgi:molybdopterin-guanine dinucleotide biosynthesis protein A